MHTTIIEKMTLITLIRSSICVSGRMVKMSFYADMSRTQLENKVKWCRELLELGDVLDPGLSLLRGSILFELQAALVGLAKNLLSNDIITKEAAKVCILK